MSSRAKGKRGELEVAEFLRALGYEAARSQQYNGRDGGADVVCSIAGMHIEVKRTERLQPYTFMQQAVRDAKNNAVPTVWMRSNNREWLLTIRAMDMFRFAEMLHAARVSP